ncbi:hypothetical protein R70331_25120 [Paenibacillus sp. FSL R7-0331]|nr:hypothetical protein R70331_25120 [Paenibacillus sp. FSL R7-0331]
MGCGQADYEKNRGKAEAEASRGKEQAARNTRLALFVLRLKACIWLVNRGPVPVRTNKRSL